MPNSANVIPIKPKRRQRKPFEFPRDIERVLWDQQCRVYEALAVAKLLAHHARDLPPLEAVTVHHLDVQAGAAEAIVRLLKQIDGLNIPRDLILYGVERGLIPRKEAANG